MNKLILIIFLATISLFIFLLLPEFIFAQTTPVWNCGFDMTCTEYCRLLGYSGCSHVQDQCGRVGYYNYWNNNFHRKIIKEGFG